MAGLGGMHEERRRAGGGKGGCDLAGDMAGFAEPGDDDAALGAANEIGRPRKGFTEIGSQRRFDRGDAAAFGLQGA